ncbi:hypothetical protein J2852_004875 [Azospirillum soli]|nr:hypothetical protein [Azospirillum soli]
MSGLQEIIVILTAIDLIIQRVGPLVRAIEPLLTM